jgi:hypothetical protein
MRRERVLWSLSLGFLSRLWSLSIKGAVLLLALTHLVSATKVVVQGMCV